MLLYDPRPNGEVLMAMGRVPDNNPADCIMWDASLIQVGPVGWLVGWFGGQSVGAGAACLHVNTMPGYGCCGKQAEERRLVWVCVVWLRWPGWKRT